MTNGECSRNCFCHRERSVGVSPPPCPVQFVPPAAAVCSQCRRSWSGRPARSVAVAVGATGCVRLQPVPPFVVRASRPVRALPRSVWCHVPLSLCHGCGRAAVWRGLIRAVAVPRALPRAVGATGCVRLQPVPSFVVRASRPVRCRCCCCCCCRCRCRRRSFFLLPFSFFLPHVTPPNALLISASHSDANSSAFDHSSKNGSRGASSVFA